MSNVEIEFLTGLILPRIQTRFDEATKIDDHFKQNIVTK